MDLYYPNGLFPIGNHRWETSVYGCEALKTIKLGVKSSHEELQFPKTSRFEFKGFLWNAQVIFTTLTLLEKWLPLRSSITSLPAQLINFRLLAGHHTIIFRNLSALPRTIQNIACKYIVMLCLRNPPPYPS